MADIKISQMDDGGLVQDGDQIPVARGGANYRVQAGTAASRDSSEFATAAQGALADNAVQPSDLRALALLDTVGTAQIDDDAVTIAKINGVPDTADNLIYSDTSLVPNSSNVTNEVFISQTDYDALPSYDLNTVYITDGQYAASEITYNGGTVKDALDDITSGFNTMPIGVPFPVRTDLGVPAPSNAGTSKFIELTYGKSGSGGYNEGLLTSEATSGSFPTSLVATAQIVGGVMNGQTIRLLNTMNAFIRPSETGGVFQNDQMQVITGDFRYDAWAFSSNGAFTASVTSGGGEQTVGTRADLISFSSANSPNARTGTYTSPHNESAIYFMRIV